MTDHNRSKAILQAFKAESAWDPMMEYLSMTELERSLLSIQMHLADAMTCNEGTEERRLELEHAWHELAHVMYELRKDRSDGN
jgi:hypothetical protein